MSCLAGLAIFALGLSWMHAVGWITWPCCFAMLIGGFVGAVELLGRYKYAPVQALFTLSGLVYVVINVVASWFAFYAIQTFPVFAANANGKDLLEILTAGFGSLVFMRSALFKVRVSDSDIGIGPAAILDTFLLVADRGVDRRAAVARALDVSTLVASVPDPDKVARMLATYSLALMQNVDRKTIEATGKSVGEIMTNPEIESEIRLDIVALRLGDVVGPDVLEAAVQALGIRLKTPLVPAPVGKRESSGGVSPAVLRTAPTDREVALADEIRGQQTAAAQPTVVTPAVVKAVESEEAKLPGTAADTIKTTIPGARAAEEKADETVPAKPLAGMREDGSPNP